MPRCGHEVKDQVALAAAIDPIDRVYEGDPAQVGHRNSGPMRTTSGRAARAEPHDAVPMPSLAAATGEIASELAARLLQELRAAGF